MSFFTVDSAQIMAANANVQNTIAKLTTEADSLLAQLQSLQSSWQGQAANSFQDLAMRWRTTAAALDTQLGEIAKALALAAAQYSEIEAANTRLFL